MKNTALVRRGANPEEIAEWVQRYRASGIGLRRFAQQHGLSPYRLHYWVYHQQNKPPTVPAQGRVGVPVFQEIKLAAGRSLPVWAVEMEWPTGLVLRFHQAVTPSWMSTVVAAMRQL